MLPSRAHLTDMLRRAWRRSAAPPPDTSESRPLEPPGAWLPDGRASHSGTVRPVCARETANELVARADSPSDPSEPRGLGLSRRLEKLAWVVGIACVAFWLLAQLETRITEARQREELAARMAALEHADTAEPPSTASAYSGAPIDVASEAGDFLAQLDIPRLELSAMVVEGTDDKTLSHSVGWIPGTAAPGSGNTALAAHRDSFFRPLEDIQRDDAVWLRTPGLTYLYYVDSTEVVEPTDVRVLADADEPKLTLVTCYPFRYVGRAPRRFIVHARLAGVIPHAVSQPERAPSHAASLASQVTPGL